MIFTRATIRLTAAFATVQLALFAAFAIGVYVFVTGAFDFDAVENDSEAAINAAEQGFATLRNGLIVSYCVLVLIVPAVSYLMARLVLQPIRRSYDRQIKFVDGASHELRTPLSIIQGELELAISTKRAVTDYEAAITIALEEIEGLTDLTNDLLLLSQSDGFYPRSAMISCSLNDLVEEAVARQTASRGMGDPVLTIAAGTPASATISRSLIMRAVINLIDNGLKFTPGGGIVTVQTERINGYPAITVTDTGIGMAPHAISHSTDRFWRAEEARTRPGHGLGLALVQQIMNAHAGTFTITSTPGVGTVARLVFAQRGE
ncbi:MAG: sensor histidine kinase [Pseudomonas sp.]